MLDKSQLPTGDSPVQNGLSVENWCDLIRQFEKERDCRIGMLANRVPMVLDLSEEILEQVLVELKNMVKDRTEVITMKPTKMIVIGNVDATDN